MNILTINISRVMLFVIFTLLLTACQSTASLEKKSFIVDKRLFLDEHFPESKEIKIETMEEVFAIDDRMRIMVKEKLMTSQDIEKRASKLINHIFDKNNVALAYSSDANVIAVNAYNNQKANCLSLTILAYSLAKEANLEVVFQNVKIPEYWVRNGSFSMLTGHVNLVIKKPRSPHAPIFFGSNLLTIDFDPFVIKTSFPKTIISQSYVLSMFYSNKGAQAIVDKDFTKAYAYFKAAIEMAPNFSSAWANLGILYRMQGYSTLAKKIYRIALEINPENYTAMGNLSLLLDDKIDSKEKENIHKTLRIERNKNPYYYALLADEAFHLKNYGQAITHYRKAIKLNKHAHEFYFGLAKVYFALNENKKAQRAMSKAISYNRVNSIDLTYIAKLNYLKHQELSH